MILDGIEPTAAFRPNRHGGVALVLVWRAEGVDFLARLQPDGSGRVHEISPGYNPASGRAEPIERPPLYFSHPFGDAMRDGTSASELAEPASLIVRHILSHPDPEVDRPRAVAALRALVSHFGEVFSEPVLSCSTPKRDEEDDDFADLFPWYLSDPAEDFLHAMRKDGDLGGWTLLRRPAYPDSEFLEYSAREISFGKNSGLEGGPSAHEQLEAMLDIEAWCRDSEAWRVYGARGERHLRAFREAFIEAGTTG